MCGNDSPFTWDKKNKHWYIYIIAIFINLLFHLLFNLLFDIVAGWKRKNRKNNQSHREYYID